MGILTQRARRFAEIRRGMQSLKTKGKLRRLEVRASLPRLLLSLAFIFHRRIDAESLRKLGAELLDGFGDLQWLLSDGSEHALAHVGFLADQFHRRHNQRDMIVDVVPHGGQVAVKLA